MQYAKNATDEFSQLSDREQLNTVYLAGLAASQLLEAKAYDLLGNLQVAKVLCRQVTNQLASIVMHNKEPRFTIPYIRALDCLAEPDKPNELLQLLSDAQITKIKF